MEYNLQILKRGPCVKRNFTSFIRLNLFSKILYVHVLIGITNFLLTLLLAILLNIGLIARSISKLVLAATENDVQGFTINLLSVRYYNNTRSLFLSNCNDN